MWARDLTERDGGWECNPLSEARCCSRLRPFSSLCAVSSWAGSDPPGWALSLSEPAQMASVLGFSICASDCETLPIPLFLFLGSASPTSLKSTSPRLGLILSDGDWKGSFIETRKLWFSHASTNACARGSQVSPASQRARRVGIWATLDHSGERRQHAVAAVHAARQLANPRLCPPSPPLHLASPVCASKSVPLASRAQRFDRWENPPLSDRQRPPSPVR